MESEFESNQEWGAMSRQAIVNGVLPQDQDIDCLVTAGAAYANASLPMQMIRGD